jgi:hypothetical protein
VVARVVQRERRRAVTTAEVSVEVDAPPQIAWQVAADPRNLPHWDRHIVSVSIPTKDLAPGVTFEVAMRFMSVRAKVRCEVLEWEPPWRSRVRLRGVLDATVTTSIAALPYDRCVLRHEVTYVFKGPFGRFAAASLNAVGGAQLALKRGALAQKREIEARAAKARRR